jgi:hypothetical protein
VRHTLVGLLELGLRGKVRHDVWYVCVWYRGIVSRSVRGEDEDGEVKNNSRAEADR